jgi:hypothetical protein
VGGDVGPVDQFRFSQSLAVLLRKRSIRPLDFLEFESVLSSVSRLSTELREIFWERSFWPVHCHNDGSAEHGHAKTQVVHRAELVEAFAFGCLDAGARLISLRKIYIYEMSCEWKSRVNEKLQFITSSS